MIIYNGKNSLTDFDLYIASKDIPVPTRKVITETVPYMSGVWDFSFHDGGVDEYEELTIKYEFDVIADNKKELNRQRIELTNWLHSRGVQKLYDTDISTTEYYSVYRAQASWSEEGLQGLLSVEFSCYPFRKIDFLEKGSYAEITNTGTRPVKATVTNHNDGTTLEVYSLDTGKLIQVSVPNGTHPNLVELPVNEAFSFSTTNGEEIEIAYSIEVM